MADPNFDVLMFMAHRAMEERVLVALRAAGFDDVTLAQGRVFARIGSGGTWLTDLAEMAQVTKQTAGFLVDRLADAGYVERVPDPPTPAPGSCASPTAAGSPRSALPARSPRWRPSGRRTWG